MFQQQSLRRARLSDFHAILVASRHMYGEFQRHGVPSSRLHLVPLPSPVEDSLRLQPLEKVPGNRILFSGRLTDIKGGEHLIGAVAIAARKLDRPLTLQIAGDGPQKEQLRNLAGRLGVSVEFTGWLDCQQMLDRMREASLLAVPSVWPEPFGLVGVEAAGLGLPAVGYAVGGVTDWLISGESGELAPGDPPTVQALADAIVRALSDARHYNRLCVGAWRNAARFRLDQHLARLEPILASASRTVSENPIVPVTI
jgi:glycosyltransferase involved in cell wall biosynthesis